jgi:hypothetical protein
MKTRLAILLCVGLLLVPSAAAAQDDFSGRWELPGSTNIAHVANSPFGVSPVITQTADTISWQAASGETLELRLNGPSTFLGRTYTVRWLHRALLLEGQWTWRGGRTFTVVQILFRNTNGDLELVSVVPDIDRQQTASSRLIYKRQ